MIGLFVFGQTEAQSDQGVEYPGMMKTSTDMFFAPINKPGEMLPLKDVLEEDNADTFSRKRELLQAINEYDNFLPYIGELSEEGILENQKEDGPNRVKRRAKIPDNQSAKIRGHSQHYEHPKLVKDRPLDPPSTTKKPTIQPENMTPGVIFRVRMSDAILRIKQRMYEDPERHIESDIVYANLIKKVVADEIVKFNNLLLFYRTDRSVKEHVGECGGRIYKFITFETIKVNIYCVFDALWIDGTPYVIGDDYTVTPLEVPAQLQCDAAECTTITRHKQKKHHKSKPNTSDQTEEPEEITEQVVQQMRRMVDYDLLQTEEPTTTTSDVPDYIDVPKDLYQAHLTPGVIFRVHLTEAIIKMQYRNYAEDVDSSVVEADSEYMRLARKLVSDELDKFQQLAWLVATFNKRHDLVSSHTCNAKYYITGVPPTNFSHTEENMKRACLFNSVFLDRVPYVVGDDGSLMAAVAPPVLQCDAAICISVPYVDSIMFDEKLPMTHVRTITRCQSQCRAQCTNDQVCLDRCAVLCDATS